MIFYIFTWENWERIRVITPPLEWNYEKCLFSVNNTEVIDNSTGEIMALQSINAVSRTTSQEGCILSEILHKRWSRRFSFIEACSGFTWIDSLPEHERPSPANPSLQEQLCPPAVLMQLAFGSQSLLLVMHSSTSILQTVKTIHFYPAPLHTI